MKLYYFETLNPRKVCAVAKYLKAPVEYVRVDLGKGEHRTEEFRAINPNAKVPALSDGETNMWESNAIMCYLAKKAGSDLWPGDDARRIDVIRWLSWDSLHFTRHGGNLYFEHIIKRKFALGDPDPATVAEATKYFRQYAAVLDSHLRGRKYLIGDGLTVADFAVAATLPYAEDARLPLADFPEILRWHGRMNELEAWREPYPAMAETA